MTTLKGAGRVMRTIAIVGASANRAKFGNKSLRAYLQAGWKVYPIHPRESVIEGLAVYPTVRSVPETQLDRISIYVPPDVGRALLSDLASKPAREVWFNPGSYDPELLKAAESLGLAVVPGCSILAVGINPHDLD